MVTKPNSPEELYQFFTQGMIRKPIDYPIYGQQRQGWSIAKFNIYDTEDTIEGIEIRFASYIFRWELEIYKYVET